MADAPWDAKLKSFLKKAGDDFKRVGAEVQREAERLLADAKDPARQQKVREGLNEVGTWAKQTAEDVAHLVEDGVKKAEGAIREVVGKVPPPVPTVPSSPAGVYPSAPPPPAASIPDPAPTVPMPTRKTVGPAKKKRPSPPKAGTSKKPLGRRTGKRGQ